jgi:hypothetical protein
MLIALVLAIVIRLVLMVWLRVSWLTSSWHASRLVPMHGYLRELIADGKEVGLARTDYVARERSGVGS